MKKIRMAIAGVGNCASSLVQGLEYYKGRKEGAFAGLMHKRIEKHLVNLCAFGPMASPTTTSSLFDALIRKEAAWKNLLAVPGNILFPRREERRFELSYQISRIRSAMSRGE